MSPPPVDVFLRLACLLWRLDRSNPARARRLLADHPELAAASIYTAAATGDVAAGVLRRYGATQRTDSA